MTPDLYREFRIEMAEHAIDEKELLSRWYARLRKYDLNPLKALFAAELQIMVKESGTDGQD